MYKHSSAPASTGSAQASPSPWAPTSQPAEPCEACGHAWQTITYEGWHRVLCRVCVEHRRNGRAGRCTSPRMSPGWLVWRCERCRVEVEAIRYVVRGAEV